MVNARQVDLKYGGEESWAKCRKWFVSLPDSFLCFLMLADALSVVAVLIRSRL